jgi:predicted RND superfamily exporter protein
MLATTLVICSGLSFFILSDFLPVSQFAICLILIMLSAVLADLILLPALLLQWYGR